MKRFIKVSIAIMLMIPALLIGCGNSSVSNDSNSKRLYRKWIFKFTKRVLYSIRKTSKRIYIKKYKRFKKYKNKSNK